MCVRIHAEFASQWEIKSSQGEYGTRGRELGRSEKEAWLLPEDAYIFKYPRYSRLLRGLLSPMTPPFSSASNSR